MIFAGIYGNKNRKNSFQYMSILAICSKRRQETVSGLNIALNNKNETLPFTPKEFFEKDQRLDSGEWWTLSLCSASTKLIVNANTFSPSNANVF